VPLAPTPAPIARILARGRPAADRACAGCAQLGTFRALRRAGVEVQGGLGCDAAAARGFEAAPGRWAALAGVDRALADARGLLASAAEAGARLVVVADAARGVGAAELRAALAAGGARAVVTIDPGELASAEAAARAALDAPASAAPAVLVALSPCARGAPGGAPLSVAAARCNRCGACLALGCPAISDVGGDAMMIDGAVCTGCGLCAPLCRSGALGRAAAGDR
jgi:TPP-dependent indolepyruvate ferredoxin oxidoreductase alpha subunit